jgi:uncharacterized membrane protein YdjX (TVP38/TMEM64 family)
MTSLAHSARLAVHLAIAVTAKTGPLAFFGAMAILPALGFPMSAFTLAAGPLLGPRLGVGTVILCATAAMAANAALSYALAARTLRPTIERLVRRFGRGLPELGPRAAWPVILAVRITPGPPFFVQSYFLGLARVPFAAYMLVSTLVPAGQIAAIVLLGNALVEGDRRAMAGAAAIFALIAFALHRLRKRIPAPRAPR